MKQTRRQILQESVFYVYDNVYQRFVEYMLQRNRQKRLRRVSIFDIIAQEGDEVNLWNLKSQMIS